MCLWWSRELNWGGSGDQGFPQVPFFFSRTSPAADGTVPCLGTAARGSAGEELVAEARRAPALAALELLGWRRLTLMLSWF